MTSEADLRAEINAKLRAAYPLHKESYILRKEAIWGFGPDVIVHYYESTDRQLLDPRYHDPGSNRKAVAPLINPELLANCRSAVERLTSLCGVPKSEVQMCHILNWKERPQILFAKAKYTCEEYEQLIEHYILSLLEIQEFDYEEFVKLKQELDHFASIEREVEALEEAVG